MIRGGASRKTAVVFAGMMAVGATAANAQGAPPPAPAPEVEGGSAQDIVVTAQRRTERLQDVPIAVTALSGATLESSGIRTTEQLTQVTPGLVFSQRSGNAQAVIRGIGTQGVQPGDESSVAIYVDGVYFSQMAAQFLNLANISAVEILKGPQGTLFGRNATGGAINITTRNPSYSPTFEVSGLYGSYNERMVKAYAAGGVTDKAAIDLSGFYRQRGNYFTDLVAQARRGALKEYGARSKLRLEPSDKLTITVIGDGTYSNNPQGSLARVLNRNSIAETLGFNTSAGRFEITQGAKSERVVKQYGVSLEVDYAAGPFDLISVTAYRHDNIRFVTNNSGTAAPLGVLPSIQLTDDYTQEFRIVSTTDSALKWVAGAYYFNSTSGYHPLMIRSLLTLPPSTVFDSTQKTEAYAVFVDGTLNLSDRLSITGGARYSDEARSQLTIINGTIIQPGGTPQNKVFTAVTPRAVISYKPVRDVMLYASYAKGFKAGLFNPSSSVAVPAIRPAKIDAYEVGAKTKFGRFATINASAFWYEYHDLQVNSQSTVPGSVVAFTNAATARMKGADIDATFYIGRDFQIGASAAYLDARYRDFPLASVFIPKVLTVPGTGNNTVSRDVSGNHVERAPKWTFSVTPRYTLHLGNDRSLSLSGNAYYNDGYFWDPINRIRQKSYVMLNAQAELKLNPRLSIIGYIDNIASEDVYATVIENAGGDRADYLDARTVGVRVQFKL